MLKEFLEEVVVIAAGKPSEPIADLLYSKKHVNEFIIAKKLDLTINQTRNILYKISDFGFVSSIRKKDKKKGWYTYFWKIETIKALEFLREYVLKRLSQFENQINSRETKTFYVCERCNLEFNEENAMNIEFSCPECGDVLSLKDNTKLLKDFKKNSDKLSEKLKMIEEEIEKENQNIEKLREKERKNEEKEKNKKKEEKKEARRKVMALKKEAKSKEVGKIDKKVLKKKIVKKKIVKKKVDKKKIVKKKTSKKSGK
jgi:transcription initiation factor TFIIE subunit alpha